MQQHPCYYRTTYMQCVYQQLMMRLDRVSLCLVLHVAFFAARVISAVSVKKFLAVLLDGLRLTQVQTVQYESNAVSLCLFPDTADVHHSLAHFVLLLNAFEINRRHDLIVIETQI